MVHLLLLAMIGKVADSPKIVRRTPVPYVAIRSHETMKSLGTVFPRHMPILRKWADRHQVKMVGPEFMRFNRVDMDKGLDIEIGFPVAKSGKAAKPVSFGVIPGGRYVSLIHYGPYSGLVAPNEALQVWARKKGLKFARHGKNFVGRVEFYYTDPDKEPDASKWKTEILYMVR